MNSAIIADCLIELFAVYFLTTKKDSFESRGGVRELLSIPDRAEFSFSEKWFRAMAANGSVGCHRWYGSESIGGGKGIGRQTI